MKTYRAAIALVGCAIVSSGMWTADSWGQAPPPIQAPSPYVGNATIILQQADVYSGPATSFYPTSRLRYNESVIVLGDSKKAPGWVEILPPAGSFSWIEAKYVKVIPGVDKIGIVDAGDSKATVPVMPGSALVNKEPNVEIARVATGTQLLLLDRPTTSGANSWYPIKPVATEVRFLPAEAVRGGGGMVAGGYGGHTQPTSWQTPGNANVGGWQPAAGAPQQQYPFVATAQQADQALQAGHIDRAKLLYIEALGQTTDPAWRTYLTNQLMHIAQASGQAAPPATAGSSPGSLIPPWTGGSATPTSGPPAVAPVQKKWSEWGVLRGTTVTSREGQPVYILENRQTGSPIIYVTTNAGMSLRDYVGQTVAIYGTVVTRNDEYIRNQFLVAEQVATPPGAAPR